jgi:D-beta-D-heptose 7-phosphate kinase/D-beta-D-heptose 1-phosphate adenosyltransferase
LPTLPGLKQIGRVNFRDKLLSWEQLPAWRAGVRGSGRRLVVTNGCFDLLHLGHVTYLETARNQGDLLLVGVNADAAVRQLKGPGRPVNRETDRALVLAALESVSAVTIFPQTTATAFLALAQPDIYVKGGDYTIETINQDERRVVEAAAGRIVLVGLVEGRSTTNTLKQIGNGSP